MPDLSDLLRQAVAREAASYEPSPDLPRRIARRTLQLQRRRRGRIVGGAAVLAVAIIALPVMVNPSRTPSNSVGVASEPVHITAGRAPAATPTTTTVPIRLLDLQAFVDNGIRERNEALKSFAAALKKQRAREAAEKRDNAEVLGAIAARGTTAAKNASSGGSTATTKPSSSATTTEPRSTTTTDPPPTTQPTAPFVPLTIVAPEVVCSGVPAVFRATGTDADLVVWSNLQVGATATFVLTESTTIVARLDFQGVVTSQAYSVQVTPTGTPPC